MQAPTAEERHHLVRVVLAATNIGLGVLFIWGSLDRFSAPAWRPLLSWTDGNVSPFGVIAIMAGLFMLGTRPWVCAVGAFLSVNWHSALAANFIVAIFMSPEASATGAVAYASFTALSGVLLAWDVTPVIHRRRMKR